MADELEVSSCACGQGQVRRRFISKMDDWNRYDSYYSDYVIDCPVCASKYHIGKLNNMCYLVPNGLDFRNEPRSFYRPMPLVVKVYHDYSMALDRMIADFQKAGSASNVLMTESREVLRLAKKELGTQSVKKISAVLIDIRDNPAKYREEERKFFAQWDGYKRERYDVLANNSRVLKQSFELNFARVDHE